MQVATWLRKISEGLLLADDWDGHAAPAPVEPAAIAAVEFLALSWRNRLYPRRVAVSAMGGYGVTYRREGRSASVQFYNDGTVCGQLVNGADTTTFPVLPGERQAALDRIAAFLALPA